MRKKDDEIEPLNKKLGRSYIRKALNVNQTLQTTATVCSDL